MTLRTSHGSGAASALVRVEVLPPDELPDGVSDGGPAAPLAASDGEPSPHKRKGKRTRTTFSKGDPRAKAAGEASALALKAKREAVALLEGLGLRNAQPDALAPYLDDARAFSANERARLARSVGGGVCEGSAALLVDAAALATAASRAAYASGDPALGARLSAEARSNLLGAFELCAREGKARASAPGAKPEWERRLFGEGAKP